MPETSSADISKTLNSSRLASVVLSSEEVFRDEFDDRSDLTLLDACSGCCHFPIALKERFPDMKVAALDKRIPERPLPESIEFFCGDINKFHEIGRQFDCLTINAPVIFTEEFDSALKIMKKDGLLIVRYAAQDRMMAFHALKYFRENKDLSCVHAPNVNIDLPNGNLCCSYSRLMEPIFVKYRSSPFKNKILRELSS